MVVSWGFLNLVIALASAIAARLAISCYDVLFIGRYRMHVIYSTSELFADMMALYLEGLSFFKLTDISFFDHIIILALVLYGY